VDALQVVAEPRRREILRLVWDRELAAGDIAARFDVSFAAVSQHLGVLRAAGFVSTRHEGRKRFYRADRAALGPLRSTLESMWSSSLDRLVAVIEEDAR
jgi:DNA-binding transcriptional ArsR family regulator